MCIGKRFDVKKRYTNTFHNFMKMKDADLMPNIHIIFHDGINIEKHKFNVGDL